MGRGGLHNGSGGHVKIYPCEKGGGGVSHGEGGVQQVLGYR